MELHAEEIKNAVSDLLLVTGNMILSQIMSTINAVINQAPDWLIESNANGAKKEAAVKAWLDKPVIFKVLDENASKFYDEILQKTLYDDSIDGEFADEVYKCLGYGFNMYKIMEDYPSFKEDIGKVIELRRTVENGFMYTIDDQPISNYVINLIKEKGDSITAAEMLNYRLDILSQFYKVPKETEEDKTDEETNEFGNEEPQETTKDKEE